MMASLALVPAPAAAVAVEQPYEGRAPATLGLFLQAPIVLAFPDGIWQVTPDT